MSSKLLSEHSNNAELAFTQMILNSYFELFQRQLINRNGLLSDYDELVEKDFYLVSHRFEDEPRFVFATKKAIELWETTWDGFYRMPSRYSAEEDHRAKREKMLQSANLKGYFEGYEGIRISSKKNRFRIKDVLIFNVSNVNNEVVGQAALFYETQPL